MIKPVLLVRLLKERLAHNEAYLAQDNDTRNMARMMGREKRLTDPAAHFAAYDEAVREENEFLRVVLEEPKKA